MREGRKEELTPIRKDLSQEKLPLLAELRYALRMNPPTITSGCCNPDSLFLHPARAGYSGRMSISFVIVAQRAVSSFRKAPVCAGL